MKLKIKDAAEFQRLLHALANELVDARIHFRLYSDLTASVQKYHSEVNQSGTFWSLTFQAHLDASIFRLCKIYDKHSKTLNLQNLLDTIESNISIFDEENFRERLKGNPFVDSLAADFRKPEKAQLAADRDYVSDRNPLVKNLTEWRNNFFAHRSARHVITQKNLSQESPLTVENVGELLAEGMKILNRYSSLFEASTYSTQIVGHDDFQYVLESIRQRLAQGEKQFQEEMKRWEKNAS